MIDSWATYKNWISDTIKGGEQYYFRGQRKSGWRLQSTFHRYAEKTGITLVDYLDRIIPEVSYYASAAQNEDIDIANHAQFGALLARLQHHGFPTPLLDWTLSPYIAAYFAFKDIDPHQPDTDHVVIYMFDFRSWSLIYDQPLNLRDNVRFVSAFRPHARNNPRMIQQMAVTTATNVFDMGRYFEEQGKNAGRHFLYHAMLPVSERRLVMNELNLMGINSMTLFPDFDGICASMRELFFNNYEAKPLVPNIPPPPPPRTE